MAVIALLPAHNEEATLQQAVSSLRSQSRVPDRIIVLADNCTDSTVTLGKALGCEVYETVGNTEKKSGALNQIIPTLNVSDEDFLLVQDADSRLAHEFISTAVGEFDRPVGNKPVGAVGGIFYGDPVPEDGMGLAARVRTRWVSFMQRMEYTRYSRDLARSERVWVLTGTATMLSGRVVQDLIAQHGTVYEPDALTEDMRLTLDVRSLDYALVSPPQCVVMTETMGTWGSLFQQRLRWQRGALENLRTYGIRSRVTWPYFAQQAMMAVGAVALALYLLLTVLMIASGTFGLSGFWMAIGAVFVAERVITVWAMGWRARAVAALLIPDLLYDLFLQVVLLRAAADAILRRQQVWHHPTPERI